MTLPESRKLRILFAETSLPIGGAERVMQSLLVRIDLDRFQPVLCCFKEAGILAEPVRERGIPVIERLYRRRLDPMVVPRFLRLLAAFRAEVVVTNLSSMNLLCCGAPLYLWRRPRFLLCWHTTRRFGRRALEWHDRLVVPRVQRHVALGRNHQRYLTEEEGIHPDRVVIVPNGIDIERFHPDGPAARDLVEFKAGGVLIGIVAVLRPEKRHDLFVDAARRVHDRLPHVRFAVIGDGPERSAVEESIRRHRLAGLIRMTGGRDDIEAVHRALDVCVLSSDSVVETLPLALIEALATGRPVVSTRVGCVDDIVQDGRTGLLVPCGDATALSRAMIALARDPKLRRAMGAEGRDDVSRRFSLDRMVRHYEALFLEMVGRGTPVRDAVAPPCPPVFRPSLRRAKVPSGRS